MKLTADSKAVVDARKPLRVTITDADVRKGASKQPNACAAAKALCRQTHCEVARVHLTRTYVRINGRWVRYLTPQSLRAEIIVFDRGGEFEPGTYTLAPPQAEKRLGNRDRKAYMAEYNQRAGRNKGAKRKTHTVKHIRGFCSLDDEE